MGEMGGAMSPRAWAFGCTLALLLWALFIIAGAMLATDPYVLVRVFHAR